MANIYTSLLYPRLWYNLGKTKLTHTRCFFKLRRIMLKLIEMTQERFQHYMLSAVETFAKEKVLNGTWAEEQAFSKAQAEYNLLLPEGLQTPNNYFYSILEKGEVIGYIWTAQSTDNARTAFIYDFEIYEEFQNQGFGSTSLELISLQTKQLGFSSLALHVFGSNSRALHVYKKMGFEITDINMQKEL